MVSWNEKNRRYGLENRQRKVKIGTGTGESLITSLLQAHFALRYWQTRTHCCGDTLLLMMFLGLRKLGNICCVHKMFLNKIRNILCPQRECCARGQTEKHLCRQQRIRNNVSSFASTFMGRIKELA